MVTWPTRSLSYKTNAELWKKPTHNDLPCVLYFSYQVSQIYRLGHAPEAAELQNKLTTMKLRTHHVILCSFLFSVAPDIVWQCGRLGG